MCLKEEEGGMCVCARVACVCVFRRNLPQNMANCVCVCVCVYIYIYYN